MNISEPPNLFLAHTPYHALLACGIASEEGWRNNSLMVFSDFVGINELIESLGAWQRNPFGRVMMMTGNVHGDRRLRRRWREARCTVEVARYCTEHRPGRVFVFHDGFPMDQAAMHFSKKANPTATCTYVEDGAAAYNGSTRPVSAPLVPKLLDRLGYGSWFAYPRVVGTTSWIDQGRFIFPALVRPELSRLKRSAVSRAAFTPERIGEWLSHYLRRCGSSLDQVSSCDGILIVEQSTFADLCPQYVPIMRSVLEVLSEGGLRFAVKYHTRETKPDFLGLSGVPTIEILPSAMPVELLFVFQPKRLRFIVGDFSTPLITARWLLDGAVVISLMDQFGPEFRDASLARVFERLGVRLVENNGQLKDLLGSQRSTATRL